MKTGILIIILLLVNALIARAQTDLSGTISKDSTLLKSKSPFTLKGTLTIKNNAKLTIENGCEILLGSYNILVGSSTAGTLQASNVTFSTTSSSDKYILFQDGGQGNLTGCTFTKVYVNVDDDAGVSLSFTGNSFSQVKFPFKISPNTTPVITGNSSTTELIALQGTVIKTTTLPRYAWNYEMTGTIYVQNNAVMTVLQGTVIDLRNYAINVGNSTPGTLNAGNATFKSTYSAKSKIVFKDGGKAVLTGNQFSNVYLSVESDASDDISIAGNNFTQIDLPVRLDVNRAPVISGNQCQIPRIGLGGTLKGNINLPKYDWGYTLWTSVSANAGHTLTIGSGISIDLAHYFICAGNSSAGRLVVNGATFTSSYASGYYLYFRDGGTGSITGCSFDKAWVLVDDDAGTDIIIRNNTFSNVVFPIELSANRAPVISGNTASPGMIGLKGSVTASNTLPRYQWPYKLRENVTVKSSAVLTLADSVFLDLDTKYVNVGTGTTSPGTLNGKKLSIKGQPGNRGKIQFYPGAGGLLENCCFEQCYIRIDNSSPVFRSCRFFRSGTALEIKNAAAPVLRNNDFYNNETAILHTGTQTVDATDSFWGHQSGPQHPANPNGKGEAIQGNVLFTPFRQQPVTGNVNGTVTPVAIHFGNITTGTRIDTSFTLLNSGNIDLLITAVNCKTPNVSVKCPDRFWLYPDSALAVPFSFTSLNGKVEKDTITLENGNAANPRLELTVTSYGIIEKMHINFNKLEIDSFPRVKCYFTVTDQANIPISGITKDCLTLKEDGLTISDFSFNSQQNMATHVAAALVIDQSGSMAGQKLRDAKTAATAFIHEMASEDRGCIISFEDRVYVRRAFMTDKAELVKGIQYLSASGETALFNAIAQALELVKTEPGNRAIVALTDGLDNRSSVKLDDIVSQALEYGISIYTIGLGDDAESSTLRYLSKLTGGEYYFAPGPEELSIIYKRISGQLQNQYLITYNAAVNRPFPRTLTLTVNCIGPSVTNSIRYTTEKQTIEFLSGAKPFCLDEFRKDSRSYFYYKTAGSTNILDSDEELMFITKSGTSYIPYGGRFMGDSIFQFWVDLSEDLAKSQLKVTLPDSVIHNGSWILFKNKPASFTVPLLKNTLSEEVDLFAGGAVGVKLLVGGVGAGPSIAAAALSAKGTGGMGLTFARDEGGDQFITRRFELGVGLEAESPAINGIVGDVQAGVEAGIMVKPILGQTMRFPPTLTNDAIKAKTLFLLETFSLGAVSLSPDCSLLKIALMEALSLIDGGIAKAYESHYYSNLYGLNIEGKASLGATYATGTGSKQNKMKLADIGVQSVYSGQFITYPQNNDLTLNFGYALEGGFSLLSLEVMNVKLGNLVQYTAGADINLGTNFNPSDGFHSFDLALGLNQDFQIIFGNLEKRRELSFNVPKKVITRALNGDNIIRSLAPFMDPSAPKMDFQIGKDYFLNSINQVFTYATGPLDDISDHIVIELSEGTTKALDVDLTVKIDAAMILGGGLELGVILSYADEKSTFNSHHTIVNGKLLPLADYHEPADKDLISLKDEVKFLFENTPKLIAAIINGLISRIKEAVEAGKDFLLEGFDQTCTFAGNLLNTSAGAFTTGYAEIASYVPDVPGINILKSGFTEREVIKGYMSTRVIRRTGNVSDRQDEKTGILCLVSNCYKINVYNDIDSIIPSFDPCLLTIAIDPARLARFGFTEAEKSKARICYYNFSTLEWEELAEDLHSHPDTVAALVNRSGTYGVAVTWFTEDDKEAPAIEGHYPVNGGIYNNDSLVWAKVTEPLLGAGIDPAACSLTIDGKEAELTWNPVNNFFSTKPAAPLPVGTHTLMIKTGDYNGNIAFKDITFTVTKETHIPEIRSSAMDIRCWPNPVSEVLYIEISGCTGEVEAAVYNNLGQRITDFWLGKADGSPLNFTWKPLTPNNSKLPTGVCFVRVRCGDEIRVKKVLIR